MAATVKYSKNKVKAFKPKGSKMPKLKMGTVKGLKSPKKLSTKRSIPLKFKA